MTTLSDKLFNKRINKLNMFVLSTNQVGVTQRVVATLVACAVVMATIGFYNTAQAANLTNVSNTLTDSAPTVLSGHTFAFTVPAAGTAIAPGDTITIAFPATFTGVGTVVDADVTVSVAAGDVSAAATVAGSGSNVTVTGITVAAGEEVVVAIADTRITNPAKVLASGIGDSYEFSINTGLGDSGKTRVAIVENVLVTAIVETTFDFVITGLATTTDVNGEATTGSTTPTSIPFGVLVAGTPKVLAQQLNVTTNARNGFVVTVEQDGALRSSTGADIDSYLNGTDVVIPGAWAAPNGTLAFGENGFGHWGLTTEDGDVNSGTAPNFTAIDQYIAVLNAPQVIFGHTGVSDGTTTGAGTAADDDIGQTQVGYKIEITPLQEAGDDYNTTLTYIATPTF
jgi:hypothetical protein